MATDKIIVAHAGALKAKYGAAGLAKIRSALKAMAADARRGLSSKVVAIDSAAILFGTRNSPSWREKSSAARGNWQAKTFFWPPGKSRNSLRDEPEEST